MTGDVSPLALDSDEEKEIGTALASCLDTLPTPIGETVAMMGPWSKLASTLGGAILKRMAMIAAVKAAQRAAAQAATGPRTAAQTVPTAPAPAQAPPQAWEVVAPVPQSVG